jgi:hypothetical protein
MPETQPEVHVEGDGTDIFVVCDGVKIAKRGRPGTQQAKTWISLEPGFEVMDGQDLGTIVVTYNGVQIH